MQQFLTVRKEKWLHDGHGTFCGGIITRVLVKKRTKPQTYKIKRDDGSTMNCEEQHIEQVVEEDSEEDNVREDTADPVARCVQI